MKSHLYQQRKQIRKYFDLVNKAEEFVELNQQNSNNFGFLLKNLESFEQFKPAQKFSEITFLLDIILKNDYHNLCEIGTYKGGSLFLFCQAAPDTAKIISIDINYPLARKHAHKKFAKKGQRLFCIQGDTKSPDTFKKTQTTLRGQQLDFLFIDGDHSLFGVMNDYVRFSPLVRKGGIIAFHDIQPDMFMRTGVKSDAYVGAVPLFWEMLKKSGVKTEEMIEDPDQDGFGIGLVHKE